MAEEEGEPRFQLTAPSVDEIILWVARPRPELNGFVSGEHVLDIDPTFALLVSRVIEPDANTHLLLDAWEFEVDTSSRKGKWPTQLFALSPSCSRLFQNPQLDHLHFLNKGWEWRWGPFQPDELPSPPFLFTNDSQFVVAYSGRVAIHPNTEADEFIRAETYDNGLFAEPVAGRDWVGQLQITKRDYGLGAGYFLAFSNRIASLEGEHTLMICEVEIPFGSIVIS